jgi:two-component sensor histidine kinase
MIAPAYIMINILSIFLTVRYYFNSSLLLCVFLFFLLISISLSVWLIKNYKVLRRQLSMKDQEIALKNIGINKLKVLNNALLAEKEQLLHKVHHRVKNNLQIVISLINAQSSYLQDESAKHALSDSQLKLQTMLIIIKKLYGPNGINRIEMPEFINELAIFLRESYLTDTFELLIQQHVAPICLNVAQAGAVGFFISEVVAQVRKYEFTGDDFGLVNIELSETDKGELQLSIYYQHDEYSINNQPTADLVLIHEFSLQLNAVPVIEKNKNTRISLKFMLSDDGLAINNCSPQGTHGR